MEVVMDAELARKAIALLDLTDLADDCRPAAVDSLTNCFSSSSLFRRNVMFISDRSRVLAVPR